MPEEICDEWNRRFENAKNVAYKLLDGLDEDLIYHNKNHTLEEVVPATLEISDKADLSDKKKALAGIAAVFHDTGFLARYTNNEPIGAEFAEKYMEECKYSYSKDEIEIVTDAIESTNLGETPTTIFAKILRDADLVYIARDNFRDRIDDLQREVNEHPEASLFEASKSRLDWYRLSLEFLENSDWFTEEAEALYSEEKEKNLNQLERCIKQIKSD